MKLLLLSSRTTHACGLTHNWWRFRKLCVCLLNMYLILFNKVCSKTLWLPAWTKVKTMTVTYLYEFLRFVLFVLNGAACSWFREYDGVPWHISTDPRSIIVTRSVCQHNNHLLAHTLVEPRDNDKIFLGILKSELLIAIHFIRKGWEKYCHPCRTSRWETKDSYRYKDDVGMVAFN